MLPPLEKSALESLAEGAQSLNKVRGRLQVFLAKLVGVAAMVYGVLTWNAYYAVLGLVVVMLFRYLDRRETEYIRRLQEPSTNSADKPRTGK